jgi:hypothetical protein
MIIWGSVSDDCSFLLKIEINLLSWVSNLSDRITVEFVNLTPPPHKSGDLNAGMSQQRFLANLCTLYTPEFRRTGFCTMRHHVRGKS